MKTSQLLEKIKSKEFRLLCFSQDANTYGEWLFVGIYNEVDHSTYQYSSKFGFHYIKECYVLQDSFSNYLVSSGLDSFYAKKTPPSLEDLEKAIKIYYDEIKVLYEKEQLKEKTEFAKNRDKMYDVLSMAGDEDGAVSMLEDMNLF
jgi:hypothetical protein